MAYADKMGEVVLTACGPKEWVREIQHSGSHRLAQWFSAGELVVIFFPRGHSAMSVDIFDC